MPSANDASGPAAAAAERPKTLYQGVERDGFGMRLLSKMGWVEGKGLGKNKDGIATHVRAKKRMDFVGVGADARNDASGKTAVDWTMNTLAFDDVLKSLNRTHSAESLERTVTMASSSSSEEEVEEAPAEKKRKASKEERRAAKKEAKRAKKEAKKAKKNEIVVNRSVVSHAGRYQKRVSQKMVSNYSSQDLAQILGGGFVSVPEVRADNAGSTSASEESKEEEKKDNGEKKKLIAVERPKWVFDPPPEDWWGWRVGFRPEGHGKKDVGEDVDALERKRGFDEDDQINLFQDTHAGANKNRQGLGAKRGRDAGADFAGSKKTFGEGDEITDAERAVIAKAKQVKWQKIALKMLSKADGSMKTKKFREKVLQKCGCAESERDVYWDAAFHVLSRTEAFTSLEEDVVKLIKN